MTKLIELVQSKDDMVRHTAVLALKDIGKPANRAEPVLLAILNSRTESEAMRNAAKDALKVVDERHQFTD